MSKKPLNKFLPAWLISIFSRIDCFLILCSLFIESIFLPTLENLEEEAIIVLTIRSTILDKAESIVTLPPSGPLLKMTISLMAVVWA